MENTIYQYAIGELLDGRYFYIPSYQRGYRWTDKQVGDLLRDLLCFVNDFDNARKEEKLKNSFSDSYNDDIKNRGVWEIIDGQQRLTTIFLLYKYLLDQKGWEADRSEERRVGKECRSRWSAYH